MDHRQHLRIQIPLGVEVTHPAIGTQRVIARDVSEGGIFAHLISPHISIGAKLKIRLLNAIDTDTRNTPTVDVEVKRVSETGMGLQFVNATAKHLWSSVVRLREELEVGRDYFQVHQSALISAGDAGILLVQQDAKWLLPGHYLTVGQIGHAALHSFLERELQLKIGAVAHVLATDSAPDISVQEAATYRAVFQLTATGTDVRFAPDSSYREFIWIKNSAELYRRTFASEFQRDVCERWLEDNAS